MTSIYIIKSKNSNKYYIDYSNYSYPSLILHKHIHSYKSYIKNKNKTNFKYVYNLIDQNDIYIEILEKDLDIPIAEEKIKEYIKINPNIIEKNNNIKNYLEEINIYKIKKTKEDKREYLKNYYQENKEDNKEKLKEYYQKNKVELRRKSRRHYKSIKDKNTISKDITYFFE